MGGLNLGATLESVLNRMVADLEKEGVELSYNVNFYSSKRGMRATVQLCVTPKKVEESDDATKLR